MNISRKSTILAILFVASAVMAPSSQADEKANSFPKPTETDEAPQASDPISGPLGFIDMGHVFKNYKKFTTGMEELKREVESLGLKGQIMAREARQIEEALKQETEGSPRHSELEEELIKKKRAVEDFKRVQRESLAGKESALYKTVYLEVADVVRSVANEKNYIAVLRFNRASVREAQGRDNIVKLLNREVVFHRSENDLTDEVIARLNKTYKTKVVSVSDE